MIEYKGYLGTFEFDPEMDAFHGRVLNTNDVISFYGVSVAELRREMRKSIDEYLAFCREQGREPEEPFSGNLQIHTPPDLHRRIALEAARSHVSLDTYVREVLEKAVSTASFGGR